MSCSELSAGAREPLAGTATRARRLLLVEVRQAWGRDVVPDSSLPAPVKERLTAWSEESGGDGRVLFMRKPERRDGTSPVVLLAHVEESGGTISRLQVDRLDDLATLDLVPSRLSVPVAMPTFLVCTHGRRDPCCARLGVPVWEALRRVVEPDAVWQCSHLGGHRFAANVLALPHGVLLGRVRPGDAGRVAAEIASGAIPLAHYRGRVIHEPAVQAAEVAVRERLAAPELAALRYLGPTAAGDRHCFETPAGPLEAIVERMAGPLLPASCGAPPEPSSRFRVHLDGFGGSTTLDG